MWLALSTLALIGGVVPIAIASHFGALGIPRNDDWAYILSAFRLADSGRINGYGWAGMNLVGQLVLSAPVVWAFGHRIAALQIEVATFGVAGLVALFDLAKRVLSPRRALFVALMVAVGPMWASLSASYMTDVPAFALAMVCLALGARAVRADGLNASLFSIAVLAGFLAFSVREYAIVAPLSVCLTAVWAQGVSSRRRLRAMIGALASLVVLATIFFLWRRSLPGFQNLAPRFPSLSSVKMALHSGAQSMILIGLLVSPAVLLAGPYRRMHLAWTRAPHITVGVGLVTVLALGSEVVRQRGSASFLGPGNYVVPTGTLGVATISGTRPDLLPKSVFLLLAMIGILTVLVLLLAALPASLDGLARVRRERLEASASPTLAIVTLAAVGYALTASLPTFFGIAPIDRYLLPLLPLVGVLALYTGEPIAATRRRLRIGSGAALLAVAIFGLIYAANAASFDGAKWSVSEHVAKVAGSPTRIEGGFEWDNYHAGKEIFFANQNRPTARFCIVLRGESHPTGGSGELRTARVWSPNGTQMWIVARQRYSC